MLRPALSPVISGLGRSPSARPGGHHHAGPSQPRRNCALSSTAKPAPRPRTCSCSTGPRTSRPRAAPPRSEPMQKQKAHSRAEHWSSPRAPQAQKKAPRQEGSKTASRAARNTRKKPSFANKCDAHRAKHALIGFTPTPTHPSALHTRARPYFPSRH